MTKGNKELWFLVNNTVEEYNAKITFKAYADSKRPWSDCAFAQSDQGLRCPLTESLDTIKLYLCIAKLSYLDL